MAKEPIANIKGEKYYGNYTSMKELMHKHSTIVNYDNFEGMIEDSQASGVYKFPNPNVPVVFVYGSHLSTEISYDWDYYPETKTRNYDYGFPNRQHDKYGDGTVEVSYSLPIALKWAWEHLHGTKGAKPVKVAEYCSSYNQKQTPWDGTAADGSVVMTKTEYMSAPCSCLKSAGEGSSCKHNAIIGDPDIIEFVAKTCVTKQKPARKEATGAFVLSNNELRRLTETLPHLTRPRDDVNVRSWLNLERADRIMMQ